MPTTLPSPLFLALVCLWLPYVAIGQPKGGAAKPVPVHVQTLALQPITDRLNTIGTAHAQENITLTSTVTERITAIHFTDGQRVNAGDLLISMDSAEETADLTEQRAQLLEATRQLQRREALLQAGSSTIAARDAQQREVDVIKARIAAIESRLAERQLRAPFAGVLGLRQVSVGALAQPGTPITTLDADAQLKLDFAIPAIHANSVRVGDAVSARSNAFPDTVFTGKISAIAGRIDPTTRTLHLRAMLPNPDYLLRPGTLLDVTLHTNPRSALLVPELAIRADDTAKYVMTIPTLPATEAPIAQKVLIEIGSRTAGFAEVTAGLNAGDTLITDGAHLVRPGQTVQILQPVTDATP